MFMGPSHSETLKKGVTKYAGGTPEFEIGIRRCLTNIVGVFKHPLAELTIRAENIFRSIQDEQISELGMSLAVGENFSSSRHTDQDCSFTFSGSFSTHGKVGNSFVFPGNY